jgi:hypothetical protein
MTDTNTRQLAKSILNNAHDLLVAKGWTQGAYAKDVNGTPVGYAGDDAACFCSLGAIFNAYEKLRPANDEIKDYRDLANAYGLARRVLEETTGEYVPSWNDAPNRTVAEVLAAFRTAAISI